jgi:hypothetical protein
MPILKNLWIVGLVMVAACGDSSPAKVTAPSVTSITVSGIDLLLVGQSETLTAAGSDGAPVTTARWGTDTPDVVSVESYTGRITAVGAGTATVFADLNGVRGTKSVRTLPNFNGVWTGTVHESGCEATGDWAHLGSCPDSPYDLWTGTIEIELTQDLDTISGRLNLFGAREGANVSGTISPDGTLSFTGAKNGPVVNVEYTNVRFTLAKEGKMTGTFEQVYSDPKKIRSGTWKEFVKLGDMYH